MTDRKKKIHDMVNDNIEKFSQALIGMSREEAERLNPIPKNVDHAISEIGVVLDKYDITIQEADAMFKSIMIGARMHQDAVEKQNKQN